MEKIVKLGKLTFICNDDDTYLVSACDKDATEVEIPTRVNNIAVTGICAHAFEDCTMLEKIVFPEFDEELYYDDKEFKTIGAYAFSGCSSLKSVEIPDTVFIIERGIFYSCTALESIILPRNCYISPYAFAHCSSLKELSPIPWASEGMLSHCKALGEITLLPSLKEIDEDAFEHTGLVEITIPKNVKHIGQLAFRSCYNLKSVTFEDPEKWYWKCRYDDEIRPLDLSSPEKNAQMLSRMDFDDGVSYWFKK